MTIDAGFHRILIELVVTYVLLSVFVACAVLFVLMLVGRAKPDQATRRYLFSVFGLSALGLLIGGATDFLRPDVPRAIQEAQLSVQKSVSKQLSQGADSEGGQSACSPTSTQRPITVFTQVGFDSDRSSFDKLKKTLAGTGFILPGAEAINRPIPANLIKYCNPKNATDADQLQSILRACDAGEFGIQKIPDGACDRADNLNVVELWLRSPAQ